jgi:hypothetical protein
MKTNIIGKMRGEGRICGYSFIILYTPKSHTVSSLVYLYRTRGQEICISAKLTKKFVSIFFHMYHFLHDFSKHLCKSKNADLEKKVFFKKRKIRCSRKNPFSLELSLYLTISYLPLSIHSQQST